MTLDNGYQHDRTFDEAASAADGRVRAFIGGLMANAEIWFRCPQCGVAGVIDGDQAGGFVSIQCVTDGCTFHETGIVKPLIFASQPLSRDQQFTITDPSQPHHEENR